MCCLRALEKKNSGSPACRQACSRQRMTKIKKTVDASPPQKPPTSSFPQKAFPIPLNSVLPINSHNDKIISV